MTHETGKSKIALVIGDEDLLGLIRAILASERFELVAATTGRAGLDLLQEPGVALVILDLALPDMNGWEFFLKMQAEGAAAARPRVIILATQASRVDRTFGLRVALVHDYLVKPFLPSQLRRAVAAALQYLPAADYRYNVSQYTA